MIVCDECHEGRAAWWVSHGRPGYGRHSALCEACYVDFEVHLNDSEARDFRVMPFPSRSAGQNSPAD